MVTAQDAYTSVDEIVLLEIRSSKRGALPCELLILQSNVIQ